MTHVAAVSLLLETPLRGEHELLVEDQQQH
jgi:hypothetical protein